MESERQFGALLTHGWDGQPARCFAGLEDGRVLVYGNLWTPIYDNPHYAEFEIVVHPDRRRRGLGSQVLRRLEETARAEQRPRAHLLGIESAPFDTFALHHGYRPGYREVVREQDLTDLPPGWRDLLDETEQGAAADYELLYLTGRLPDDLIDQMPALWTQINDAPTHGLDLDDEVFDVARLRAYEAAQQAAGATIHRVIARHRPTGELSGHTIVAVEGDDPSRGHQHDTTVGRAHRGHRLGFVLKATMMVRLLRSEPRLRTIDTWNAEDNDHMIAVNQTLGYRVKAVQAYYRRRLA